MVTLGHINYLNCIPVHGAILLKKVPFDGAIVTAYPSQLNQLLKGGRIDISPSSSIEIINGYRIVPGLSISGKEDVQSIVLLTRKPLEKTRSGLFYVTAHSATSVMLLKVILKELYPADAEYHVFDPAAFDLATIPDHVAGVLFIGDYALRLKPWRDWHRYDLAELWYQKTGLPFTFALWQVNPVTPLEDAKKAASQLRASYEFFKNDPEEIASAFADDLSFSVEYMLSYWKHLSFELLPKHIESLRLFFTLCRKYGLVDDVPHFHFLEG